MRCGGRESGSGLAKSPGGKPRRSGLVKSPGGMIRSLRVRSRPARSGRATAGWLAGRKILPPSEIKAGRQPDGAGREFSSLRKSFCWGNFCREGKFLLRKFYRSGKFTLRKFLAVQNKFGVWIVFRSHSDMEDEYNNFTERVGLRITLFVTKTIMEVVTGHIPYHLRLSNF